MSVVDDTITEAAFQRAVVDLAHITGWLTSHFHDSRRQVTRRGKTQWVGDAASAGFPDLVMVRAPRLILAELKSPKGRLAPTQREWLAALVECPAVETYLWRPCDWDEIERVLIR